MANIFVGIRTCNIHKEWRDAQRETWLPALKKLQDADILDYKYFTGCCDDSDELDVVVTCVQDKDTHLTHKTKAMMEYAYEGGYDWFFLCNDTTYVVPIRLMASGFQNHHYTGYLINQSEFGLPFMNGHAVWFSRHAMDVVLSSGALNVVSRSDDAIVGRELYGMVPFNADHRYRSFRTDDAYDAKADNEHITNHNCTPEITRSIHKAFIESFK